MYDQWPCHFFFGRTISYSQMSKFLQICVTFGFRDSIYNIYICYAYLRFIVRRFYFHDVTKQQSPPGIFQFQTVSSSIKWIKIKNDYFWNHAYVTKILAILHTPKWNISTSQAANNNNRNKSYRSEKKNPYIKTTETTKTTNR